MGLSQHVNYRHMGPWSLTWMSGD